MRETQPHSHRALKLGGHLLRRLPLLGLDRFGHYMARMFEPYDLAGVHATEPREGFSDQKVISVKGVEVVIIEVGPGHHGRGRHRRRARRARGLCRRHRLFGVYAGDVVGSGGTIGGGT